MKKFLALVLALVMALSLVACGSSGTTERQLNLVSLDAEHVAKLLESSPYYTECTIKADVYGTPTDITTVGVGAVLLARNDVSEEAVYNFCKDIYDNAASLTSSHAKYGEVSLDYGASITSVPYHPGAAKYFAEKGYTVTADAATPATVDNDLRFVTGGDSGTYYAFGSVIAQHATNNAGVAVTGLVGNGSQANIMEMQDGNAELAFCQSDVMAYAYDGTNLFADTGAIKCFSTVGALYTEQVQIVTLDPTIKTVADLKGKNVSIGAAGSGVYFNALDILGVYGMTESDIKPTYQSFGDSADSLKDGKIDAAFIVAGAPTTAIVDLAATTK